MGIMVIPGAMYIRKLMYESPIGEEFSRKQDNVTNSKENSSSDSQTSIYMEAVPVNLYVHLSSSVSTTKYPSETDAN